MNEFERQILVGFATGTHQWEWGAAVGACIEFLQEDGYLTRGLEIMITQKGLDKLAE